MARRPALAESVAVNYSLRALTWHEGSVYLMEQPIFGFDKQNEQIRLWPKRTLIHDVPAPFGK